MVLVIVGGCKMKKKPTDKEVLAEMEKVTQNRNLDVPGEIVVGFKKGISREQAETVIKKYNLAYEWNENPSAGKKFYYETGEKFVVKVPTGEEQKWIETFNKEPNVKMTTTHFDSSSGVMVD